MICKSIWKSAKTVLQLLSKTYEAQQNIFSNANKTEFLFNSIQLIAKATVSKMTLTKPCFTQLNNCENRAVYLLDTSIMATSSHLTLAPKVFSR